MKNIYENYLLQNLKKGRKLNILFLSGLEQKIEFENIYEKFSNCSLEVKTAAGGASIEYSGLEDYDIIVCYDPIFYNESFFKKMQDISLKISNDKEKRVSIGYETTIKGDKMNSELFYVNFVSVKNSQMITDTQKIPRGFSPTMLANMTLYRHDAYNTLENSFNDIMCGLNTNSEIKIKVLK